MDIDGSHAYRFDKAALIRSFSGGMSGLTFGEVITSLGVSQAMLDRWAKQDKITPLADMDGKQRWFA